MSKNGSISGISGGISNDPNAQLVFTGGGDLGGWTGPDAHEAFGDAVWKPIHLQWEPHP